MNYIYVAECRSAELKRVRTLLVLEVQRLDDKEAQEST